MRNEDLFLSPMQLEAGLDTVRQSPSDAGTLEMIVVRPQTDERQVVTSAEISLDAGVVGDNWSQRRRVNPDAQITIMNMRAARLIAQTDERVPLAGDQLYVDMDLSEDTLPIGQRIQIGSAVLEVSPVPHNGCKKFANRFGVDAVKFVNSAEGKQLHLRGINMRVIEPGDIQVGDRVEKVVSAEVAADA